MAELAAEENQTPTAVRIFVGGLGERVTEEELRSIFGSKNIGRVDGVDIVRTKGRSFAYCDFLPSSPASLSKIFSTYNGCVWKGGRLRLEKAKEHYLARMKHEWEEDAALASPPNGAMDAEKVVNPPEKPKKSFKSDGQIHIFFPRLRKVKPLPLKGTGKHKYSFQRFEPLLHPKHFCDCAEHSGASLPSREQQIPKPELPRDEIGAEEFDLMRSVMNKLFEKEMGSESVQKENKPAQEDVAGDANSDELQPEDSEEEDEDGLVINMVRSSGNTRKRMNKIEDEIPLPQRRKKEVASDECGRNSLKIQNTGNLSPERGYFPTTNAAGEQPAAFTTHGEKKQNDQLETRLRWSQKSSWRKLLGDKTKSSFSVSHILTSDGPSTEGKIGKDNENSNLLNSVDSEDQESVEDSDVPDSTESEDHEVDKTNESDSVDNEDHELDEDSDVPNSTESEDHELDKTNDSNSVESEDHELDSEDESDSVHNDDYELDENSDVSKSTESEDHELHKNNEFDSVESEDRKLDEGSDVPNSRESKDDESEKTNESDSVDSEDDELNEESDVSSSMENENRDSDEFDSLGAEDNELDNHETVGDQTEETPEPEELVEVELKESNAGPSSNAGRGVSWLHKSSWTQIMADSQNQSFSLSRICSSAVNEEMQDSRENVALADKQQVEDEPADALVMGKKEVHRASSSMTKPKDHRILQNPVGPNKDISHRRKDRVGQNAGWVPPGIGEECLFMRSSASIRGWANSKAALTGSRKRKKPIAT